MGTQCTLIIFQSGPVEKYGLKDLFNVKREKDEAYIRTCGVTQLVKGSDITKDIKDPLSLKYKEWSGNNLYTSI